MNRELPKISVVTITYGHEKYITETLDGVLMQQYDGPVEFIIANDNSPDATDEVVKKYFLENPAPSNFEIKYTKHETNKGMMPNFIWALEQATGKYIALCEGDDYWTDPLKLEKQVVIFEKNGDVGLVYTDIDIYDVSQNKRIKCIYSSKIVNRSATFEEHIEKRGYLAPLTWMFRASILKYLITLSEKSVDPSFEIILTAFKITKIHYLDAVTGVRNVLQNSASNHIDDCRKYKYLKGLFEIQRSYLNKYSNDKKLKDRIYFANYLQLMMDAKKYGDEELFKEATTYLLEKVTPKTKKERLNHIRLTVELQKKNTIEAFDYGERAISSFLQVAILKVDPFSKFNLWVALYKFKKQCNLN